MIDVLGLIGGGGSVLAVPILLYGVGVGSAHVAIGTAALAVSLNALVGLAGHARAGTVKWPCALVFAAAGVAGALAGAALGKQVPSAPLLGAFGLLMIGAGIAMLRRRAAAAAPDVRLSADSAPQLLPRLLPAGFGVGLLAGFFGIGGGFLIVPGLMAATAMPLRNAIGTSLVAVAAFGVATASSYALAGYIDWALAGWLVLGGIAGAIAGLALGKKLATRKQMLETLFASAVIAVGLYVIARALLDLNLG
jgi:uncharacterized protein